MKKSFAAVAAGVLTGAVLLMSTAPAMAHDRIGFSLSVGVPVAPAVYAPAPVYTPPVYAQPAYVAPTYGPVVYSNYAPVVSVGTPYYYGAHYYRGPGWYGHGYHEYHGYNGYHGWHR